MGAIGGAGTVMLVTGMKTHWGPVALGCAFVGEWLADRALTNRAGRKVTELQNRCEFDAAETLLKEIRDVPLASSKRRDHMDLWLAVLASSRGQHAVAMKEYERIAASPRMAAYRGLLQNNIAWSLVNLGETARGLELATATLADAEAHGAPWTTAARGTFAVALLKAGRPHEAAELLDRILVEGSSDGALIQALRAFYLGEARTMLGERDLARRAYERALRECPQSVWATEARAKLS